MIINELSTTSSKPIYQNIMVNLYFIIKKVDPIYKQGRALKWNIEKHRNTGIKIMNSIFFFGALWEYVLGLAVDIPNFRSGISRRDSMEDFGDIEKLLKECKSGFKASTIKADYMTVSRICGVPIRF